MSTTTTVRSGERTLLQKAALAVSAVFVLVGILGFIPGITTHYDNMGFAGHDNAGQLLGLFAVTVLHNIVHILFGLAGFALARTWDGARTFLIGGGVVYLVLWLYGLIVDRQSDANFLPLDRADNWLHLLLGVGMIGLGYFLAKRERDEGVAPRTRTA